MKLEIPINYSKIILFAIFTILIIPLSVSATTIKLQTADTENLADASVKSGSPNLNFGTDDSLEVKLASPAINSYIMFNLSSIPVNQQIDSAYVCMFLWNDQTTPNITAHHVFDHTWDGQNETTITWNNQVCGDDFDNSTNCNLTAEDIITTSNDDDNTWQCWSVVNMVANEYANNDDDVSIVFHTEEGGTIDKFYSKEYTNASLRPYLNITYSTTNNVPVATTPTITPATVYTTDTLNCSFTVTDADVNDSLSVNYTWYNGSTAFSSGTINVTNGTSNSITLDSSNTIKGETWNCSVIPYDGTSYGTEKSAAKTIQNSLPTAPVIDVLPNSPDDDDDLAANIVNVSTDADNDSITYSYQWYKNNVLQAGQTASTLSNLLTSGGETWKCVVTPNDGTGNGATGEDSVNISGAAPFCGDGSCNGAETCSSCSADCGSCGGGGGGGTPTTTTCEANWTCTDWTACTNNYQIRTCVDSNNCETTVGKPIEKKYCGLRGQCVVEWECTDWGECLNNIQTRTCTDKNSCGITATKPVESQDCISLSGEPVTGSAISVPPYKAPNPYYVVPTLLLLVTLIAIASFSRAKVSKKTKNIIMGLHISLIVAIILLLLLTFVKSPITGHIIDVPDESSPITGILILVTIIGLIGLGSAIANIKKAKRPLWVKLKVGKK